MEDKIKINNNTYEVKEYNEWKKDLESFFNDYSMDTIHSSYDPINSMSNNNTSFPPGSTINNYTFPTDIGTLVYNPETGYLEHKFTEVPTISMCVHEWKAYTGLTECYKYCTRCDEKDKS